MVNIYLNVVVKKQNHQKRKTEPKKKDKHLKPFECKNSEPQRLRKLKKPSLFQTQHEKPEHLQVG